MNTFMVKNDFVNIIKSNACFKTPNGKCIDIDLTNWPKRFENTKVIGTSDQKRFENTGVIDTSDQNVLKIQEL